jgi:hypothetical protein
MLLQTEKQPKEYSMTNNPESNCPKIGYIYHYPRLDHPTDLFKLDIYLFSGPTEMHFDVKSAHFFTKTQAGSIERISISHPWAFEKTVWVCAGLVEMDDYKGKKEEAFTFGGRLRIDSQETCTTCTLVSSAPILEVSGATPMHKLFVEEVEVLLAGQQAGYAHAGDYEKRLAEVDHQQLYLASLEALIQKFEAFPNKDEVYARFLVYLHHQKHRMEAAGLLKDPIQPISQIL